MEDAASRLCNRCGLCCNGVLFHNVRLQPGDDAQGLVQLGLHIKRKKSGLFFQQPCPAYTTSCCTIYAARPTRCRVFECQQLQGLAQGKISEAEALQKIADVQQRVEIIGSLLDRAGKTDPRRPLSKRFEKILAEPAFEPEAVALHESLAEKMGELNAILDRDFRVP